MKLRLLIRSIFVVFIAVAMSTCSTNPVTGKKDFVLMTEAQEVQMGKEYDPQIAAMYGVYQDDKIQKFIEEKGQQMARISHRPNLSYDFKVMDSPVVNAFAVPGGYVYFTRGILAHFNNEAEFAGVLGHEIGHVTARHSVKQMSKSQVLQAGLIVGMVVSPEFQQFAGVAQSGLQLLMLKNGRSDESQSDQLGVEYSTRIGYDANYMAGFFKTLGRLQTQAGVSIPDFMSSHPNPADRFTKVGQAATEWQAKTKGPYKVNRNEYLRMIDGLIYGEDPRQGYVENNVFYHPEMKFLYPVPQGWQLQNSPTQVQMASEDGKGMMIFTLAQGDNLTDAVNKAVEGFKLTEKSRKNVKVNGYNAIALVADQDNAEDPTKSISLNSYFIEFGNYMFVFHGIASKADFATYQSVMTKSMKGFKKLTDQKKINVKPERVMIKTVPANATVQQTFQKLGVSSDRMDELAILNSMELTDKIKKGSLIKIVGK
ncbi:MAG: M48 family metalloprotease [Saprospiraceae bacterium]